LTVLGGAVGLIFNTFFVLFATYYLFRDGTMIASKFFRMLPLDESQVSVLTGRARDVIRVSVYGVLVIAVVQGVLGGLMFWILGIPAVVTWTVVMIIASIIPVVGASIIIAPAVLYLLATGHPGKAVVLALWGVLVVGMADNFLRPRLVGRRTDMHELLVFFSVLGGLQAFGALGFLLGPSVLAVTLAMLEMLQLNRSPAPPRR
jgi:predicted PurR-regulated permease PerM